MNGSVKFYDEKKGFGFIKDADSSKEYFFNAADIIDKVTDGDQVEFELKEGKRGLYAVEVKLV